MTISDASSTTTPAADFDQWFIQLIRTIGIPFPTLVTSTFIRFALLVFYICNRLFEQIMKYIFACIFIFLLFIITISYYSSSSSFPLVWDSIQRLAKLVLSNGISSPSQMKGKQQELHSMAFSRFHQQSNTEKFQLDADKAEPFIREYFGAFGFNKHEIDKLVIAAKYQNKGKRTCNGFEFVIKESGQSKGYYVAVLKNDFDGMVYIAVTSSQFHFELVPDYKGWWIFAEKVDRTLTLEEQKKLQNFFHDESLRSLCQSNSIDVNTLSEEDRKLLD